MLVRSRSLLLAGADDTWRTRDAHSKYTAGAVQVYVMSRVASRINKHTVKYPDLHRRVDAPFKTIGMNQLSSMVSVL